MYQYELFHFFYYMSYIKETIGIKYVTFLLLEIIRKTRKVQFRKNTYCDIWNDMLPKITNLS